MSQPNEAVEHIIGHDELWSEHVIVTHLAAPPFLQGSLEPMVNVSQHMFTYLESIWSPSLFVGRHRGDRQNERPRVAGVTAQPRGLENATWAVASETRH